MTTAGVRIRRPFYQTIVQPRDAGGRRHCQQKPIGRSSQAKFKTLDVIRHFYEWYRLALSRRDRNLLQKGHISSRDEWHGNFK